MESNLGIDSSLVKTILLNENSLAVSCCIKMADIKVTLLAARNQLQKFSVQFCLRQKTICIYYAKI